jgi:hypothetical protein
MRNRALHSALRNFALEAAALLSEDLKAGAELEFDVVDESNGRGPTLYRYAPRVGEFLAVRWSDLRGLPACPDAATALGAGAAAYLRGNGLPGAQAEPALAAMLERIYEDATSFAFPEERFERVYREVEDTLYRDALQTTVLAPLHGVVMELPRIDLGGGLALVRADSIDTPPELRGEQALCVLERYAAPDDASIEPEARMRWARLLTGLRLWKGGSLSLGTVAWRRAGEAPWLALEVAEGGGALRGDPWVLGADEAASLPAFLETIDGGPRAGAVSFALARFEMGCAREHATEALSDHLLALRALLDPNGEIGVAGLPLRLAALCAEEGERRAVQRRAELALTLERYVMCGGREHGDWIGPDSPVAIAGDLERHLRALLRDVLCGYLEPDLKGVADDILLEVPDPFHIEARDLRVPEPEPDPEPEPEPEPPPAAAEADGDTAELDGVTMSVDWDEDPHSYSAPV